MSAEPTDLPRLATGAGSAVPLYFDSAAHRLFAWLHRPAAPAAPGMGLVICKPFGYEALCAHRSVRAFADAAVELGVPALRFDYRGTGDSGDLEPAADQIDVWRQDVAAAVSELRRQTGVQRVCLLGFRLGALLALLAGASEAVDALILVAPVLSGRRYLRELRTTQLAAAEPGTLIRNDPQAPGVGSMEVSGFSLSAATVAHLSQLDVSAPAQPPASDVLIIDRDDLPAARGWSELLPGLGARTRYVALPGFVEMIMTAPHAAVIPQSMLAAMRDWLGSLPGARPAPPAGADAAHGRGQPRSPAPVLALVSDACPADAAPSEHPVLLGAQRTLFGILTRPAADEPRRRAVILLNAGATHHIGSGRVYVSLARRWARRGYVVLRMDLAGLGDSATRPGEPDNVVFPPAALEDVRTALDFLRQHYDAREVAVGGLCSAAYHALRAAVAGLPVNRLLMVNPQNFVWDEDQLSSDLPPAEVVREVGGYRERVLSAAAWKRLLGGQVNVWHIVRVYLHRVRIAVQSAAYDAARALHIRLPHDLGSELQEIAARGIRVVFVFARGDPGVELLRIQGGSALRRLGDRCHVHIVDSADHTFTQSRARAVLEQTLTDELFVRHDELADTAGARLLARAGGNDGHPAGTEGQRRPIPRG